MSIRINKDPVPQLFNATSLREATKGIELNRAVYVFTVVTVIYTPISFLATFFALPFLNNAGDDGKTAASIPGGFKTSFIVIPLVTYVASLAFACYFHAKSRKLAVETASKVYRWLMQSPLKRRYQTEGTSLD